MRVSPRTRTPSATAPRRARVPAPRAVLGAAVLLLVALAWPPGAARADPPRVTYLVPAASVVGPDDHRHADDGWRISVVAGRTLDPSWDVEGEGFYEQLPDRTGAIYQFGAAGHALWYLHRWPPFTPFALGGLGLLVPDDFTNEGLRLFAEAGGGFTAPLPGTPLRFRVDLRYRQVRDLTDPMGPPLGDLSAGVGLVFPLASPTPPAPAPPPPPPPPVDGDADGDGVRDSLDLCPDTPAGTPVNGLGCARDTDLDGVPDVRDRCPGTPPGRPVDAFGCEPDTDADGVINRLDACPGTRAGAKVDARGCPPPEVLRLEGVHFALDRAVLTPAARMILRGVAARLKARPGIRVEVAGHTDDQGTDLYNLRLSQRRAEAVRDFLAARGVPADALSARGYGEREPVAGNDLPADRARNRRVELRITESGAAAPSAQ
jgi:OOP family OmpA-OmpF porin